MQGHHGPHIGHQGTAQPGGGPNTAKSPLMSGGKKVKMQKPTINLSINNNVQNVIVTPAPGQYSNRQGANHANHNSTGAYAHNQPHHQGQNANPSAQGPGNMIGSLNGGQINPG